MPTPTAIFVHIGVTCKLDKGKSRVYTSGAFQPLDVTFHNKTVDVFGSTGVVLTDCDYTLLLNGQGDHSSLMVTESITKRRKNGSWSPSPLRRWLLGRATREKAFRFKTRKADRCLCLSAFRQKSYA